MRIVIFGGSGAVGRRLARYFEPGHDVTVITRHPYQAPGIYNELWDGVSLGTWTNNLEGADIVVNLAGRSVNCQYTEEHLREMMDSRVNSTRLVGEALAAATNRPKLWLQMSTATIYSHRFDAPNDEYRGVIGGRELDAPPLWARSVEIAKAWEKTAESVVPADVRLVLMRTAMVMSSARGSVFNVMANLARKGLGGPAGNGKQYVSWIHEADFHRAIEFLIAHEEMQGVVNLASPNPMPNKQFNAIIRKAVGMPIALPAPKFALELGAKAMKTETELILKSRRVIPKRLLESGFEFQFGDWTHAATDLAAQLKAKGR